MEAKQAFTGALKAGDKRFKPGDPITEAEAKELGLKDKPELAGKPTKKAEEKDGD